MPTYDPDTDTWDDEENNIGYKAPNKIEEGELYPEDSVDVQIIPVTPDAEKPIENPTPWNNYIPEP